MDWSHKPFLSQPSPLALIPFPTLERILLAVKSVTLFFLIFNLTVLEHLWTSVFFIFLFLFFFIFNLSFVKFLNCAAIKCVWYYLTPMMVMAFSQKAIPLLFPLKSHPAFPVHLLPSPRKGVHLFRRPPWLQVILAAAAPGWASMLLQLVVCDDG